MVGCEEAGDERQLRVMTCTTASSLCGPWYSCETTSCIRPSYAAQSGDNIPISYGNSESAQRDATFADLCDPDESPLASASDPNEATHRPSAARALHCQLSCWRRTVTFGRHKSRGGLACGIGADRQNLQPSTTLSPEGPEVCRGRQVGGCGGKRRFAKGTTTGPNPMMRIMECPFLSSCHGQTACRDTADIPNFQLITDHAGGGRKTLLSRAR
ncbi:uncharacterized protein F5Z01DRAFT_690293 [Emericellopsis atlantica]|uniref:Uncharacterized protein n=1 Tax=Emericellopsis atlantica TaxID=2614577 RepID=A0A9P7ZID7_9HYPO|nr:uncharacterized protein F5Z01DRAFT_690293 [Emericellopsis atlantica]KAG9252595.1 hypothetical protein F5Z01DRAFT_690293 [Emericellopsis atlantica]